MAETLISPGVLARENDTSFVSRGPVTVGAAIIGPTVKGPVEIPTVVTSYSQYQQIFGTTLSSGSPAQTYTYFTSIAAYNYFQNGGTSLLVARVVTGSYTPATSSLIASGSTGVSTPVFVLETISEGTIMNSSGSEDSTGALTNGTANNIRWQIVNSNTSSGTFDLLVRQGNDNTLEQTVLETWTNLSLDPFASTYVAKVIGDQKYTLRTDSGTQTKYLQLTGSFPNNSAYVRVKSVNITTPNYFSNAGTPNPTYTGSLPINASGSFGGASGAIKAGAKFYDQIGSTDTQGLTAGNYDNMIALLANQDDYKYNVILTPGLYNVDYSSPITSIISNTQNRGDAIYVTDMVAYGAGSVTTVTAQASARNTSYAATYWPWCQVQDPDSGQNVWVPASTVIAGVYAYNDSVSEPWFAPAGINRGGLSQVIMAERRLPQGDRDTLYNGKVNPIATFPGTGVVVYGQKTLQTRASALDRVNVRRLLIALKNYISQVANNLVFEQNTAATRNNFLAQVNPYLESVQQRQGLYAFRVIMDDSNNTPTVIDQNQMVGQIYLQPTKTAEFIYLDFNITPTGATFPA
jgi:phage tail sheath protein FI